MQTKKRAENQSVQRLLSVVKRTWLISTVLRGLLALTGVLSSFVLVSVFLDNLLLLPSSARWILLTLGGLACAGCLWWAMLRELPLLASAERVAAYFERRVPESDSDLIIAVQLAGAGGDAGYSTAMASHEMAAAAGRLKRFTGKEAFEGAFIRRNAKLAVLPLALVLLYAVFSWSPFTGGLYRLTHPGTSLDTAAGLRIEVTPGDSTIAEGASFTVRAKVSGGATEAVTLEYTPQASPNPLAIAMAAEDGVYTGTLPRAFAPFDYRILAQPEMDEAHRLSLRRLTRRPAASKTYHVSTVPPPRIERYEIAYSYPAYTGRTNETVSSEQGDLEAPVGTGVVLDVQCSTPISTAELVVGEATDPVEVDGKSLHTALRIGVSGSYFLRIESEDGFTNGEPAVSTIVAIPDSAPEVSITAPRDDVALAPGEALPLVFEAEDDYGLVSLTLRARRGSAEEQTLASLLDVGDAPPVKHQAAAVDVDFAALMPEERDLLQCWIEAVDNQPETPNRSRSRVLNVRILSLAPEGALEEEPGEETPGPGAERDEAMALSLEEGPASDEKPLIDQVEERLRDFADMQREVIEQTNNLPEKDVDDLTGEEKEAFRDVAVAEDDLSKFLEELVSDLSELPGQDFTDSTLSEEIVEVLAEVEMAEDALELQNKTIATTAEETGLELAETLIHDLPAWLSDVPDKIKWDMEEPPEDYEVPMAELPDELTDLMGELIDEEAAMTEEVEDESSSWADSIDAGAGWATMDGPISNMSAKGKTGNMLPNQSEIGGRSGEGRTGRAHGEFVEKSAVGKGGRLTPTRLTPDPYEPGVVEDSSTDPMGGATGGGKLSGAGGMGLPGPVPPDVQHAMNRLAGTQAAIRVKAERLNFKLKVVNVPAPGLEKSINIMQEIEADLRDFRYQNVLRKQDVLLNSMRESHDHVARQVSIRAEQETILPSAAQKEVLEALDEDVLPEYEEAVAEYFQILAGTR